MAEKTEQPTEKKLKDARKKGQVGSSKDIPKLAMLIVLGETAFATEPQWREGVHSLMQLGTDRVGMPFQAALMEMLVTAGTFLLIVFAICAVIGFVVEVLSHWGQFGVLIEPEAIQPDFNKLNPVNGFKNLFSPQKLVEFLLTCFKGFLIGWICFIVVRDELPDILHLSGGTPKDVYLGFIELLRSVFHIILGVCLVLSIIDLIVHKKFHIKNNMMDMEELRREYKESEGDPLMKGYRRSLARQLAMSGPVANTNDANALVVNPTHFAVAMHYDGETTPVPVVLAKGKDEVAQAMIDRARELGIPVIRHVWLARSLYATGKEEAPVPRATYEAVALVYAVINELKAMGETHREVELESFGEPPERQFAN